MTDRVDSGTRRERHIPVDLRQSIALEVHNPNGDVTIRAADRSDVFISYSGPDLPDGWGDEAMLTIEAHDNRIAVRANPQWGGGRGGFAGEVDLDAIVGQVTRAFRWGGPWFSGKPGKVRFGSGHHSWTDILIELPRESSGRVEVHTASGDLHIEDVTSEVTLRTASGDVRATRTRGDLDLHTASGDLLIDEVSGRFAAHTANGDIRVSSSQIDEFQIQTASGDIFIDALLRGQAASSAQTASGDVRLMLRRASTAGEEPEATLAFHTVSGDASVSQPFRQIDRRRWQVGQGAGPHIDITTVSGDLAATVAAVKRTELVAEPRPSAQAIHAPSAPPKPPAPEMMAAPPLPPREPAPVVVSRQDGESENAEMPDDVSAAHPPAHDDTSRLAVLEAVERGEIDVEEALRRLEAVDPNVNP